MSKKEFTATEVMALQERLEKGIAVIGEQHGTIIKRLDRLQSSVNGIREQVADNTVTLHIHGELLDQYTKILNQHSQDIKTIKSELTGVKTEMADVKSELAGVKGEVAGVKSELKEFKKEHRLDIQAIKQDLKDIKQELANVKQDIGLIKSIIVHKVDRVLYDKLEERVRVLEQKLLSLP